mmetsp:Transcript_40077/g.62708  ORF Transcript_40077/g.62708 Transcript_40077/m.62708 type:complete len:227 (-) Transcript_40077:4-684(-)
MSMAEPPRSPAPTSPTLITCSVRRNSACAARSALADCRASTTAEMLRSDEPWDTAMTLILAWPRAPKKRPETPGVRDMASPTMATMLHGCSTSTLEMYPCLISRWKVSSTWSLASFASAAEQTKQMLCSEEAWAMRLTLMERSCRAANSLDATPGTPTMPVPSTLMVATLSTVLKPQTVRFSAAKGEGGPMRVPRAPGLNELRIQSGISAFTAGTIVLGWITLAPK